MEIKISNKIYFPIGSSFWNSYHTLEGEELLLIQWVDLLKVIHRKDMEELNHQMYFGTLKMTLLLGWQKSACTYYGAEIVLVSSLTNARVYVPSIDIHTFLNTTHYHRHLDSQTSFWCCSFVLVFVCFETFYVGSLSIFVWWLCWISCTFILHILH